jgi:hypothetical protein
MKWRVGAKVPLNVYDGDRPVCQCHTNLDAILIVRAMNRVLPEEIRSLRIDAGTSSYGCGWNEAVEAIAKHIEDAGGGVLSTEEGEPK